MPRMVNTHGHTCMGVNVDGEPVWSDDDGDLYRDPLPDLSDPATLGCLLALVCEARGEWWDLDASGARHYAIAAALHDALQHSVREEHILFENVAAACMAWFSTDRLTDVALLGIAFQRGYIPATPDALEAGLAAIEERGFARSLEAVRVGRRPALVHLSQKQDRLSKRMALAEPWNTAAHKVPGDDWLHGDGHGG